MRTISIVIVPLLMTCAVSAEPASNAADRYGHLHMVLEKTWFNVDVARVDVWFDSATRDLVRSIAAGQRYSDPLAERVAQIAMEATDVQVQVELLRGASLGDFLDAVHDNLDHARDAGYLSADSARIAWQSVQADFAPLADRGLKRGDRMVYRARAGALQTTVLSGDRVLLDLTTHDPGARPAMIAGYFAPGTDFRKGLIKGMF